jgi:predicted nucleic acid-binding protein
MLYKTAVDACTLIYLSKTKLIEQISKSFQLYASNKVLEEVVKMGKEKLYKDAYYVEEMMEMGKIRSLREDKIKANKIIKTFNLEEGEASTLAIHRQYSLDIVASDENKVQNICDALGIPFTYALAMFTHCCLDEEISKDEIPRYFWDLVHVGGYSLGIVEMNKKVIEKLEVKL